MQINMKNIVIKNNFLNYGFSMIELMFALVAISVFLAAFAPVITTKFSKEMSSVSNASSLITSQDCDINFPNPYNLKCTICYHQESCVTCGGECPEGKIKNTERCTCN